MKIFITRLYIIALPCVLLVLFSCNNSNKKVEELPIISEITEELSIIPETTSDSIIEESIPNISYTERLLMEMGLINIQDSIPQILVDLKYASTDNFIGIDFYGDLKSAYVQPECYRKLKDAYKVLQTEKPGFNFLIYDAVRSRQSQQLMWDSLKVTENQKFWYIADPERGSIHNYGMSLDLTLIDNKGNILDMGTGFDYFGELAHPDKTEYFYSIGKLSEDQYSNRILLMNVMRKAGFSASNTEWWHYNATSLNKAKERYEIFSLD